MTSTKKNITHYLKKRNAKRFGLFLSIAFLFLVFSKLSANYRQHIRLKVELFNLDEEIIMQNDSLNYLNVYVEAKGFSVLPYLFPYDKTLKLDAKQHIKAAPKHYSFDAQENKYLIENEFGPTYKILNIAPDTLIMPYNEQAVKIVPIKLNASLDFVSGFDLVGQLKLDKDSVKIIGPKTKIDTINSIETLILVQKNIKTNIKEELPLIAPNHKDIKITPTIVNASAAVERFTEGTLDIPISLVNAPKNVEIDYFPKTISITYYAALKDFNAITANDFSVECDYNDIKNGKSYMLPRIVKKPSTVQRADIIQKQIDFLIL